MSAPTMPELPRDLYTVPVSWRKRDVLLFANSIGCDVNEPWYLYEGHPNFTPFPTYPAILPLKHTNDDVVDFGSHFDRFINISIEGIPRFDRHRVVDGGRTISILKQVPTTSEGAIFKLTTSLLHVGDKGKAGTAIKLQHKLWDDKSREDFAVMTETAFYLGQGGWGGPKGEKLELFPAPPDKKPHGTIQHQISPSAHLLYRLNADYNPLHADPDAGRQADFDGVIMHGLYTWNVTCQKLLAAFAGGLASHLKSFEGHFVKPVRPGDKLFIQAWVVGPVEEQTPEWQELRYVTEVNDQGACLKGRAVMKVAPQTMRSQL